ncbi:unnamed protein product [Hymenolepis diminuta]|uniref:Uncharacterized protein n=1 Tax=Hymenolepis diminuta TaxID=6216 RepID=A0A564YXL2_HYMDI|nr:unnamed protein product [Hymenolepis diminuta]
MDSIEIAKIGTVGRSIMKQMNLSKPEEDPEDHVKNVAAFHYEPPADEIFGT